MHIKIDLKIFIFIMIFLLTKKLEIYAILLLFGLIHELGHLVCGLILGFRPEQITIMPYGLKLNFKVNYNDYNIKIKKGSLLSAKKIIIGLAGPLTNIAICGLIVILGVNNIIINILNCRNEELFYCNAIIALFNLIPIYPMDGGKIIQEMLHIMVGLRKSYRLIQDITWISLAILSSFCSIIILYYNSIAILIIMVYLWALAIKTEKEINIKEKIYKALNSKM